MTKYFPVADAATLLDLGLTDLGESRDQEAKIKAAALPQARWHFVGRLQTNKTRSVAAYASVVHSVDRPELVAALADGVSRAERGPIDAFIQVSLDDDPRRGGIALPGVAALADLIAARSQLRLAGLMAVAPLGADPAAGFARLAAAAQNLRRDHPAATSISAGMSSDLEAAISAGATHVRVGTALLGPRPPIVS